MKGRRTPANQGIQADNVAGEVIAVGPGAHASKIEAGERRDDLVAAVLELQGAIASLTLDETHRRILQQEITEMIRHPQSSQTLDDRRRPTSGSTKTEGTKSITESLRRIGAVLSAAGIVARETLSLAKPIGKIAALLGSSAAALGF